MVATILNDSPTVSPDHGSDPDLPAQHTKSQLQLAFVHSCKWSKVRSKFTLEPPLLWSGQLEGISFSRNLLLSLC